MIFFNSSNSIHRVFLPSPPFSLSTRHPGLLLAASQLMLHYDHVMKIIRTIGRSNHLPSHPPSSREWYARNYVRILFRIYLSLSLSFPVKISISLNLFISQFIRIESRKCHNSLIVFNILNNNNRRKLLNLGKTWYPRATIDHLLYTLLQRNKLWRSGGEVSRRIRERGKTRRGIFISIRFFFQ